MTPYVLKRSTKNKKYVFNVYNKTRKLVWSATSANKTGDGMTRGLLKGKFNIDLRKVL